MLFAFLGMSLPIAGFFCIQFVPRNFGEIVKWDKWFAAVKQNRCGFNFYMFNGINGHPAGDNKNTYEVFTDYEFYSETVSLSHGKKPFSFKTKNNHRYIIKFADPNLVVTEWVVDRRNRPYPKSYVPDFCVEEIALTGAEIKEKLEKRDALFEAERVERLAKEKNAMDSNLKSETLHAEMDPDFQSGTLGLIRQKMFDAIKLDCHIRKKDSVVKSIEGGGIAIQIGRIDMLFEQLKKRLNIDSIDGVMSFLQKEEEEQEKAYDEKILALQKKHDDLSSGSISHLKKEQKKAREKEAQRRVEATADTANSAAAAIQSGVTQQTLVQPKPIRGSLRRPAKIFIFLADQLKVQPLPPQQKVKDN